MSLVHVEGSRTLVPVRKPDSEDWAPKLRGLTCVNSFAPAPFPVSPEWQPLQVLRDRICRTQHVDTEISGAFQTMPNSPSEGAYPPRKGFPLNITGIEIDVAAVNGGRVQFLPGEEMLLMNAVKLVV